MSNGGSSRRKKKRGQVEEQHEDASASAGGNAIPPWFANFSNTQQQHQAQVLDELKKLNSLPQRVESIEKRQDVLEEEQQNLGVNLANLNTWKRQMEGENGVQQVLGRDVQNLQARVAAAETAPPPQPDDAFDRPPMPNIIKASAPTRFTKESLNDLVLRLCHEAGLDNPSFKIAGPPHSKGFTIAFNGTGNVGKAAASQFMESRKDSEGKWKPTLCKGVALSGAEPENIGVFFNPDAPPKAERIAMLARKTKKILLNENPNLSISIRSRDSRVFVDSVPCIQPGADNQDDWSLKFKGSTFNQAQADELRRKLALSLDAGDGGEWF